MHTTTLDYNGYRNKLGITIIVSNLLIFPLIFLAYLLKGFIYEEMMELFKFFLPLKLIYLAAVVKFVIQYQKKGEEPRPVPKASI